MHLNLYTKWMVVYSLYDSSVMRSDIFLIVRNAFEGNVFPLMHTSDREESRKMFNGGINTLTIL